MSLAYTDKLNSHGTDIEMNIYSDILDFNRYWSVLQVNNSRGGTLQINKISKEEFEELKDLREKAHTNFGE